MHPFHDIDLKGFGLSGYRSFGADGFFLGEIRKVNVIIGKNNCGKSNVLRGIRLLRTLPKQKGNANLDAINDHHRRAAEVPSVEVDVATTLFVHPHVVSSWHGSPIGERIHIAWPLGGEATSANPFVGGSFNQKDAIVREIAGRPLTHDLYDKEFFEIIRPVMQRRALPLLNVFDRLIEIPNFRQIRRSEESESPHVVVNGQNIIKLLNAMQHPPVGKEADRETFDKIRRFAADLLDVDKVQLEIPPPEDQIIVTMNGVRSSLESYGTGVHQLLILCSALAIYDNYIVCIEEPEIHLHPELQRKFLNFISKETDNTYFIATHSNVFLDFLPDVSIYHVTYDGKASTMHHVDAPTKAREVLADMGYKASDLLQSNCIIWVEGPSDRIYLNKWLSLIAPHLVETIHYSITFYGGAVLAHFCAEDEPGADLVEVLRINRHAIFMIDRDGDSEDAHLRAYKTRIETEVGESNCWITEGREIENYLPSALLERYLKAKVGADVTVTFGKDDKIGPALVEGLRAAGVARSFNYANDKVGHAREIIEHMTVDHLNTFDLRTRLESLVGQIEAWNHSVKPSPESASR